MMTFTLKQDKVSYSAKYEEVSALTPTLVTQLNQ